MATTDPGTTETLDTTETVETTTLREGMAFRIRVWPSVAADGWRWSVRAEDHPYARTGSRAWASPRLATEAALAHLAKTF